MTKAAALSPGDLVTIPHGGQRIGRRLARVQCVWMHAIGVRLWSKKLNGWKGVRIVPIADCQPAPDTDRRVKAARKVMR